MNTLSETSSSINPERKQLDTDHSCAVALRYMLPLHSDNGCLTTQGPMSRRWMMVPHQLLLFLTSCICDLLYLVDMLSLIFISVENHIRGHELEINSHCTAKVVRQGPKQWSMEHSRFRQALIEKAPFLTSQFGTVGTASGFVLPSLIFLGLLPEC